MVNNGEIKSPPLAFNLPIEFEFHDDLVRKIKRRATFTFFGDLAELSIKIPSIDYLNTKIPIYSFSNFESELKHELN